jgi:hypothetical protein
MDLSPSVSSGNTDACWFDSTFGMYACWKGWIYVQFFQWIDKVFGATTG